MEINAYTYTYFSDQTNLRLIFILSLVMDKHLSFANVKAIAFIFPFIFRRMYIRNVYV